MCDSGSWFLYFFSNFFISVPFQEKLRFYCGTGTERHCNKFSALTVILALIHTLTSCTIGRSRTHLCQAYVRLNFFELLWAHIQKSVKRYAKHELNMSYYLILKITDKSTMPNFSEPQRSVLVHF